MTADDLMWLIFRMILWGAATFAIFQAGRYLRAVVHGPAEDRAARLELTNLRTAEELEAEAEDEEEDDTMADYTIKLELKFTDTSLKDAIDCVAEITGEADNQGAEVVKAVLVTPEGTEMTLE